MQYMQKLLFWEKDDNLNLGIEQRRHSNDLRKRQIIELLTTGCL